jgi:hypothetical protein
MFPFKFYFTSSVNNEQAKIEFNIDIHYHHQQNRTKCSRSNEVMAANVSLFLPGLTKGYQFVPNKTKPRYAHFA